MSYPKVQPIKLKEYTSKQSKYPQCAKLLMRSIILGPSGSGKPILLQNFILDIYAGCFDKIYIFSPSVNLDHTWLPVKEYIKGKLKIKDDDKEERERDKCFFPFFFSSSSSFISSLSS